MQHDNYLYQESNSTLGSASLQEKTTSLLTDNQQATQRIMLIMLLMLPLLIQMHWLVIRQMLKKAKSGYEKTIILKTQA